MELLHLSFQCLSQRTRANNLQCEATAPLSENGGGDDQASQPFFLDQSAYGKDHRWPQIGGTWIAKLELAEIKPVIDAIDFAL